MGQGLFCKRLLQILLPLAKSRITTKKYKMALPTKADDRSDLLTKREVFALVAMHAIIIDQKSVYPLTEIAEKATELADELTKILNESKGIFLVE